jgi:hypothetical protein
MNCKNIILDVQLVFTRTGLDDSFEYNNERYAVNHPFDIDEDGKKHSCRNLIFGYPITS